MVGTQSNILTTTDFSLSADRKREAKTEMLAVQLCPCSQGSCHHSGQKGQPFEIRDLSDCAATPTTSS